MEFFKVATAALFCLFLVYFYSNNPTHQNWFDYKAEIMRKRILHKTKICSQLELNQDLEPSKFIYNEELGLIGCVINKVGSTSLTTAFLQLLELKTYSRGSVWNSSHLIRPENSTHLKNLLKKSKLRFIFVRHPIDRLISCISTISDRF